MTRGSQGTLKLLYWQAPTILNPHLADGAKDFHASRIVLEPLLTLDGAGNFTPVLAANVPSRANGQVGEGRQDGHLQAEAGDQVGRRPAVYLRRRRVHVPIRAEQADRGRPRTAAT